MSEQNENELYKKYRPSKLSDVKGQDDAVRQIRAFGKAGKVPQCIMFVGPSGCGKTTLARILFRLLGCTEIDTKELNSADFRGIDTIRDIRDRMSMRPFGGGKSRAYLFDECQKLTSDAQSALLKMLEDTPSDVYFILCTTDPGKILSTIKNRSTVIQLKSIKADNMVDLLTDISDKEGFVLSEEVRDKIVICADGSPRKALVMLNQVIHMATEEEQLAAITSGSESPTAFEIAQQLVKGASWNTVSKLLKTCDDEPETVRRVVLGYCSSILLNGGSAADRAFDLLIIFEKDWYSSGKGGMIASCYEACLKK